MQIENCKLKIANLAAHETSTPDRALRKQRVQFAFCNFQFEMRLSCNLKCVSPLALRIRLRLIRFGSNRLIWFDSLSTLCDYALARLQAVFDDPHRPHFFPDLHRANADLVISINDCDAITSL